MRTGVPHEKKCSCLCVSPIAIRFISGSETEKNRPPFWNRTARRVNRLDKLQIIGGNRLSGEIEISGAKNAALEIIPAVILSDNVCRIENVPDITDIHAMIEILIAMGAKVNYIDRTTVEIDPRPIDTYIAPSELARNIRGSYYFLGALLGRSRHALVAMPGGCDIGTRPIDQHLKGFTALGANYRYIRDTVDDVVNISVEVEAKKLTGDNIYLDVVTVGATINIMLAAVRADGITVIENAAREPHIVDLANFLNSMGADVRGAGTDVIKIRGKKHLHSADYSIIPDQIEAGTYMVAAAATGGNVLIRNVIPKHLESITSKLEETGAEVVEFDDSVRVSAAGRPHRCNIKTMPHPGFPTDMQPQMAVLLSLADGTSHINESIWDNRFKYVEELRKMGAKIEVRGNVAQISGVRSLYGADLYATDLRAGAAMVIAGLCADGETTIGKIHYIERGYECLTEKLLRAGAQIQRVSLPDPADL